MLETFWDEHVHDWVLEVFLQLVIAALWHRTQNKETSVSLVLIAWVDQSGGGFEKYWVNFLGLDVDRQRFDKPKGNFLHVLSSLFILLWIIRLWAGKTNCFNDFFEDWVFCSEEFRIKVSYGEEVIATGSSKLVREFSVADDFITDPEGYFFWDLEPSLNHCV